jgi:CubicO group peptidase (beta-lactamase class C family)
LRSLLVICLFLQLSLFSIGQSEDLRIEIDKIIRYDTEISFKKTPGFVIGIIDNDSTYYFSFGQKSKNEDILLTKQDIFEVGSVTKIFTSAVIESLVAKNKLSYHDKLNDFLPFEYQNPRLSHISIENLINHSSGLPKRPLFFGRKEKNIQNPYEFYSSKDLLTFYRDFIPEKDVFEYSHTNYALLEIVIEHVTKKKFNDVLMEEILTLYQMKNTFADFPEQKTNLISPGYDRSQKKVAPWSFNSFKASEGVKMNLNDMMIFLKEVLKKSSIEILKYDSLDVNSNALESDGFNARLGLINGWHTIDMKSFKIITHTGKTSGHNAFVAFIKETNTAVVIFANSSIGTEDLGLQILRMLNFNWKRISNI